MRVLKHTIYFGFFTGNESLKACPVFPGSIHQATLRQDYQNRFWGRSTHLQNNNSDCLKQSYDSSKQRRNCFRGARCLPCEPVKGLSFVSWGVGGGSFVFVLLKKNKLKKKQIVLEYALRLQYHIKTRKLACYF